jgi:DNA-binding NarL/FixJ family response regulator
VVAEAENGEMVGHLYDQHRPDVVVMDLSLPGISGLETTGRILSRDASARIIVFSMHKSAVLVERALKAGVRGYVSKNCEPGVLLQAIERVYQGEFFLGPVIAQEVALDKVKGDQNPLTQLTSREFEIFRFVSEGKSSAQIARQLHLSSKTIANNISRIKTRLGVATTAEMVLLAVRSGLIHP